MVREVYLTDIERLFLKELESRGLRKGIDFSSQFPLRYSFILDFAWPDKKIAVELDGEAWHPPNNQRDATKNYLLKRAGWTVIRFPGKEITENVAKCVDRVLYKVYNNNP